MSDAVNTANNNGKRTIGKPFAKGDPRINRKGRPRSFQAFRELTQDVLHEEARDDLTFLCEHFPSVTSFLLHYQTRSGLHLFRRVFAADYSCSGLRHRVGYENCIRVYTRCQDGFSSVWSIPPVENRSSDNTLPVWASVAMMARFNCGQITRDPHR